MRRCSASPATRRSNPRGSCPPARAGRACENPGIEVWIHSFSFPHRVAPFAAQAERWGFDGFLLADSQNLNADIWVELALAAAATERISLGPGVTNPLTRHPAVTASAAATLQAESAGRAVLGLGRGDSSVAQIGLHPARVADLESSLAELQAFLAGEEAELDGIRSRIAWIGSEGVAKVPVHVAATGPRVIGVAAELADAIDFTVGAEPERLRWAIGEARDAARATPSLGAFVNVAVDEDRAAARELVRGSVAILARFATEGAPPTGLSDVTSRGIERVGAAYEEAQHGSSTAGAAAGLEDEFIDRFAVTGPAAEVAERLGALAALGLDRLIVVPGSLDADPAALERSNEAFATEVLPRLRAG